ncbi:MAG: hypothetical protein ACI89X_002093 [Planctomycetota bacterium]|jgi:hypothetical protein
MNVRAIALPLIAAGIACGLWLMLPPPEGAPTSIPASTWRAGTETDYRQVGNYLELQPETKLRLSYTCSEPRHVYVFSHSTEDGTILMFPSPDVRGSPKNPLEPGNTVLPGSYDDKVLFWTNRSEILATTTLVVVAATEPVAELEALLPHLRRWTNSAMPSKSMQITNPPTGTEVQAKPGTPQPSKLLARAADRTVAETLVNGPMAPDRMPNVWTSSLRVKEALQPKDPKNSGKPNIKLPGKTEPPK